MSRLGDILVDLGPIKQDYLVGAGFSSDQRWVRADELNELRDELLALRATAATLVRAAEEQCGCLTDGCPQSGGADLAEIRCVDSTHVGCDHDPDRATAVTAPTCSKCGSQLPACVTCGQPAQCGDSWCVDCTPDENATNSAPSSSGECLGSNMDCGRPLPCPDHPSAVDRG